MRTVLIDLLALQSLTRRGGVPRLAELGAIEQLRHRVPAALLATFDRRTNLGLPTVAVVRHGLCENCHARIGLATFADLVNARTLVSCRECGCFLLLAHEDVPVRPRHHSAAA